MTTVTLVPEEGVRITCPAELTWSIVGMSPSVTYQGANVRKQLWVAAISTNPGPGEDPSHPPFYLPSQSETPNERGAWALEPCKADMTNCDTGDECCNGFCRPSDPSNPKSPKVCGPPMQGTCSGLAEKCSTTADCCDAASGVTCIGGFCTQKSPW